MKTPAFLSKSSQMLSQCFTVCGRILGQIATMIFGNVSWRPPGWLSGIGHGWTRLNRAHPRLIAPAIITIFLLLCGAAWTWNWYEHRPKPRSVQVLVEAIPVTKLEKELKYPPLLVRFSEAAARLEDLKKTSVSGVRVEPKIAGVWSWNSDKELMFRPTEDWPADQNFKIIFDKKFFSPRVFMERLAFEFRTPPFEIAIKGLELYQDPTNPTQRQVTATLELTHTVDPGELDRHVQLTMVGGSNIFPPNDPAPHYTLTYGLHRRLAYLRSSNVTLPEQEDFMKLELSKGVQTAQGGAQTREPAEQKLRIPSMTTAFQIESVEGNVARNKNGEPEQIIVLTTTADISTRELAKALEIRLLPKRKVSQAEKEAEVEGSGNTGQTGEDSAASDEETDSSDESVGSQIKETELWKSATDVPDEVLDEAKRIEFTVVPSEKAQDRQHAFKIQVEADGELYVRVAKGVRAPGDYVLAEDHNAVVTVPELPREVQIEGQGGLLALNGDRKLSIRSRALPAIEYEVARVATSQINHLVSQTEGKFEDPEFHTPTYFNKENISRIAMEHQPIALENKWKANYSAFDFSEHLRKPADGGSERGLFFLTARGWDPEKKKPIKSTSDSRFLLVTDIGILTKKSIDGSSDVFLMSIKSGQPLNGATVDILGKNARFHRLKNRSVKKRRWRLWRAMATTSRSCRLLAKTAS